VAGGPVLDGVPISNGTRMVSSMSEAFAPPSSMPAGAFSGFRRALPSACSRRHLVWGFHFITSGKVERAGK
jgi:hypothetical protein